MEYGYIWNTGSWGGSDKQGQQKVDLREEIGQGIKHERDIDQRETCRRVEAC